MNNFDWSRTFGRFFIAWIINEDFFGLSIRIGRDRADDACCGVVHFTMQIGYGQFTIGIADKEL